MVETKTQKRKAAARVAAKAFHETAKAIKAKKTAASDKAAPEHHDRSSKSKASISDKKKSTLIQKEAGDLSEELVIEEVRNEPENSDDSGNEDEFTSQKLVVKLDFKQEKKLQSTLKQINSKKGASTASEETASTRKSCVVYVGRIPYGFFESQMRGYFAQFGDVVRVRVSRNKKTGKSKHYAFIEFAHPEVADIVAETHNNMLMCDRMIKCNVVPVEKIHPSMWAGSKKLFVAGSATLAARKVVNRKRSHEEEEVRLKRLVVRERNKRRRLEAAGIEFDFVGYEELRDASKPKRTKFSD